MARKTRRQQEEIINEIYGINSKTFEVESISVTRGGTMTRYGKDGGFYTHHIEHGRPARGEAGIVFGLVELVDVHPLYAGAEQRKIITERLKVKAAEMKAESEAKIKPEGNT